MLVASIGIGSLLFSCIFCAVQGAFSQATWLWVLPAVFLGAFVMLALLAFLFLLIACSVIRTDVPQERTSRFYRAVAAVYAEAILNILRMRVHTVGLEQLPQNGRFLLVCNHLDNLDPVTLYRFFHKSGITFISKRENQTMFLIGKLMHKLRCQLLNRENDREALKTILKCVDMIRADEASIAVFPEGYTSKDHKLHPLRNGVFKIAQKAAVPIVVCTLQNTHNVFSNARRLRPSHIELHLVGVIPAAELKGVTAVQVGTRVHSMMASDLGAENVLQENS